MVKFGVGQSVKRVEDPRLLTGNGRYTDDIQLKRQSYAYFVRSPHAHAAFTRIDTSKASKAPGVLAIVTGADLKAAGLGDVPCMVPVTNRDGSKMQMPPRPALAIGRARFVGDPVAMVVAETLAEAKDAAEAGRDRLEAAAGDQRHRGARPSRARRSSATTPRTTWCFDWGMGDETMTDAAFAKAQRVITTSTSSTTA